MAISCIKESSILTFNRDDGASVRYDLRDGAMYRKKLKGKNKGKYEEALNITRFFTGYDISDINFENETYKDFIKVVKMRNYNCYSVGTFVERLRWYSHLEGYFAMGIKCDSYVSKPPSFFPKSFIKFVRNHDLRIDTSMQSSVEYKKDKVVQIATYMNRIEHVDPEVLIDIFRTIMRSTGYGYNRGLNHTFNSLIDRGYNITTLIDKLIYYRAREAMDANHALTMLNDYSRMQSVMAENYKRYPKYLATVHDIASMNYNLKKKIYDQKMFEESINYDLEFQDEKFSIIMPKTPEDIKQEGVDQHNCVASYIPSVIKGQLQIAFLRKTKDLDKSFITVEIRDKTICQAKRNCNHQIKDEDYAFLEEYCKKKDLQIVRKGRL